MAFHDRDATTVTLRHLFWMLPLALVILLVAAWFWLLHTESGARWIWSQAESASGGALRAESISGALSSGLVARDIAFETDDVSIAASSAQLSAAIGLLPMRITVHPAVVANLRIELGSSEAVDEGGTIEDTLSSLQLPIEVVLEDVKLDDSVLTATDGDMILEVSSLSIAGRWKDEIEIIRFDFDTPQISATGSGRAGLAETKGLRLDAELAVRPEVTGLDEELRAMVTAHGPFDDLVFDVTTRGPQARLNGRVSNITADMRWEAQLDVPALALPADAGAPDMPPLQLSAEGHGDIATFNARGQITIPGTNIRIGFASEVDIGAATVSGDLEWQNARWPVNDEDPRIRSRTGKVTLSGSLDNWQVAGMVDLDVAGLPPGSLTLAGGGNREAASVEILDGNVLGGSVAGRVDYSWAGSQPINARLELDSIETVAVFPEHPAVLSGKLEVNGQQQPLQVSIQLSDVAGSYANRQLRAAGGVSYMDQEVSVENLNIRHGETTALLNGDPYAADGLQYEVFIDALDNYVDDAFGTISAMGALSLHPNGQFLRIDASSPELGWGDARVTGLNIADSGDGILDAVITADTMTVATMDAGPIRIHPRFHRDSQRVDLDVHSGALRLAIAAEGQLDDWQRPSSWSGRLMKLDIVHDDFSAMLDAPTSVSVSGQSASIEQLCVVSHEGDRSCSAAEWDMRGGLNLVATVDSIPVDLVNRFMATSSHFDQLLSGELTVQTDADGKVTGRGEIVVTPGRISSADDPELFVDTGPASIGFDIENDSLRSGALEIPVPGVGRIAAELEVLNVVADAQAQIGGLVDIDLEDIGSLLALFPIVDSADGGLFADIEIGGTVADPLFRGTVALKDGALSYVPLGLELEEIQLDSELQENGEVELTGSFRAGDGRAEIRTRADHALTAATGLELTLRGEGLTVIDVPDVMALADIDLNLGYDGQTLNLNGDITIPHARIRPANLGTTRVYESEDVIIVTGELPDEPVGPTSAPDIQLFGSVEVELGDDVVADLNLTQVDVSGNAVFTWQRELIPSALGRYDVDGEILMFGQRLEIAEGLIRYDDVPATEPYVRIRAEREIFGNSQVRRAGVLVAGAAPRPTIEPYTIPITTEERALTLLVTGSDFDLEQGVGAIGFGTYIAPRVFVSYGVGLFDAENVVRIRYDITRGFGVTATSGQKESGVDLNYRFEN